MNYDTNSIPFYFPQIRNVQMRISKYRALIANTSCPICKANLENGIIDEIDYVLELFEEISMNMELNYMKRNTHTPQEFTVEELSTFDGSNGRPAYVAVNNIVYDVSLEATWGGASHFGLYAGKDLTEQFKGCHGMLSTLSKLPKVGILK